jgi:hypothetical protein
MNAFCFCMGHLADFVRRVDCNAEWFLAL